MKNGTAFCEFAFRHAKQIRAGVSLLTLLARVEIRLP
jgi:hypothetical protein